VLKPLFPQWPLLHVYSVWLNIQSLLPLLLLSTSAEKLQELVSRVERVAKEYNMLINAKKTKVMTNDDYMLEISVDGGRLEQVDSFTSLGSRVTSNADCASDVKSRLAIGTAVMIKLTRLRKNKSVSTITKLGLMKALVWTVATHG